MTSSPHSPFSRDILIITPRNVSHHSADTTTTLFSCTSNDSIIAGRASPTRGSPIYAIASSHVVLLCSASRHRKAYTLRIKKSNDHDGTPCLLFSPEAHILYFATSLTNSVQAYHIPTASVLSPLEAHPSPPTVLAISCNGLIMLSASSRPPTTYVHDLRSGRCVELVAECQVNVNCAAFQSNPEDGSTRFVLGLKDGKVAVYRLVGPVTPTPLAKTPRSVQQLQPLARIGLPTRLHSAAMIGVCAAEFLPGYGSRIVSLGYDSRCRIADFEGADEARILRTWGVDGEATCLSISRHTVSNEADGSQCLIAIGTKDGTVGIFNMLGLLVHELKMKEPIVSTQWVGNMGLNAGGQGVLPAGEAGDEAVLRMAPALHSLSTSSLATKDVFLTPPTRVSSLRIPRRSTHKRPRIRPSTFQPPGSSARSARTSASLQVAEPIPIEDGNGTGTRFFTPPSTQRMSSSITSELYKPSNDNRDICKAEGENSTRQRLGGENAIGGVCSPPTRSSSLSMTQTPTQKSEKKHANVSSKHVGVHIRQQTETPEWLIPRSVPVPVPATVSFPFTAPTQSPPPVLPASSISPLAMSQAVTHGPKSREAETYLVAGKIDRQKGGRSISGEDESESGVVMLRRDHEELKAEVSMLRREVSGIAALLSPHPEPHP